MPQVKKYHTPEEFPGELVVSGTFLGHSKEHRVWSDKQTGALREMMVDCVIVQTGFGIVVLRCFNPQFDIGSFKPGDSVAFPIEEFKKENGLKSCIIRI